MGNNKYNEVFLYNETIIEIFKEYCHEHGLEFSETESSKFINYLSLDIYDWIKGNLKYYEEN